MTWVLAAIFRPVLALILFGLICLPIRLAFQRWMPPGKVKDFLLRDLNAGPYADWSK